MALFTTYLSHLRKFNFANDSWHDPKIYYVMLNRGNNEVAPTREALNAFKTTNDWDGYVKWYRQRLRTNLQSKQWVERRAKESLLRDVILVCYEKDHLRCHRTLLAQEIVKSHPEVNYVGELRHP